MTVGTRVRASRWMRVALILVVSATGGLSAALAEGPAAGASSYTGCSGTYSSGQSCLLGVYAPLTATQAHDYAGSHRVCAAAESSGGFYGNWVCGTGYAEHCYGGGTYLYGLVGSGDPNTYSGYGVEVWNASCP